MNTWTINNQFVTLQPGQMLALEDGKVQTVKLRAVAQATKIEVTPLDGGGFIVRATPKGSQSPYLLVECSTEELGDAVRLVLADARISNG
jgi:hypothetical protein